LRRIERRCAVAKGGAPLRGGGVAITN
jgi:hypothetical protein